MGGKPVFASCDTLTHRIATGGFVISEAIKDPFTPISEDQFHIGAALLQCHMGRRSALERDRSEGRSFHASLSSSDELQLECVHLGATRRECGRVYHRSAPRGANTAAQSRIFRRARSSTNGA